MTARCLAIVFRFFIPTFTKWMFPQQDSSFYEHIFVLFLWETMGGSCYVKQVGEKSVIVFLDEYFNIAAFDAF